jgi:hypothetical protein
VVKLVLHHLEMGDLPETATEAEELLVLDAVYAFHTNIRHWGGIGYHGIAFRSRRFYKTADWNRWGAHTYKENDDARGFAVAGDWSTQVPPLTLQQSVAQGVEHHDSLYSITALKGHRDYVATTCPGDPYQLWVPNLRSFKEESVSRLIEAPDGKLFLTDGVFRNEIPQGADRQNDAKKLFGQPVKVGAAFIADLRTSNPILSADAIRRIVRDEIDAPTRRAN